jgi:hypothetical protein
MTKEKIVAFRKLLAKFIETNESELKSIGIAATQANASFGASEARLKVVLTDLNEDGKKIEVIETNFAAYAEAYGLKQSDFGKTYRSDGKTYKIVGLKPSYRKYPIIVESGSKRYKLTPEQVRRNLNYELR